MSTSINFDGVNHDVDSVIATLISKDRQKYDSQIGELEKSNQSLVEEKTKLTSKLETLEGELEATKTKLKELESFDTGKLVSNCVSAWNEVLPSIKAKHPKFDADYSLKQSDIYRTYLKAVHDKEDIFDKSDDYVAGVYDGLKPSEQLTAQLAKDKVNSQFDALGNLKAFDQFQGQEQIEAARRKAAENMEKAYLNLGVVK